MNTFYATFIPGLQNIIADVVRERLSDVVIHKLLDGAVIFETETSYDRLNFFCFNNIFAVAGIREEVHAEAQRRRGRREDLIENFINQIITGNNNYDSGVITNNNKKFKTFRIVVSNENTPAAIDTQLRAEAEKFISKLSGLKVNRSLPDTEFWFLYRRVDEQFSIKNELGPSEVNNHAQNFSVFMKRLTLRSSWEKTLHKGELPPPLAWTLCRLARLSHNDTVLDPFCGYGSIPDAAMKYFHITNFIACDNDKAAAVYTKEKFKKRKKEEFIFYQNDFFNLSSQLNEKSFDAIITDPPWGSFKETDGDFCEKMFDVFYKLLKDDGRAVVLYANDEKFLKALSGRFNVEMNVPILLSGRKAAVWVLGKEI